MAQNFVFVSVYYGRTFGTGPGKGSFTWLDMDGSLGKLSNSSYFDGLVPLGLGSASFHSSHDVAPSDPPRSWTDPAQGFTNDDVARFLVAEIDSGRVPPPNDFSIPPAYVVFLKQGCFSKDHGNAVGYHYDFTYKGQRAPCTWVMQGDDLDGTTPIASHEMVEIISSALGYGERGDPCEPQAARIDGVMAAAYESALHTCTVPHVYSRPRGTTAWMAWKGIDGDSGIYYSWLDGDWQAQIGIPGVGTSDSPAICAHDGTLFMAWKGVEGDSGIYWSRLTDVGWSPQQIVTGVGTSSHPALASFGGVLYMAWKGSNDEGIWWTRWAGEQFEPQQNIPRRATSTGVDLFAQGQLHMAWKGSGNDAGIYTAALDAATGTWPDQVKVPKVGTSDTPSMAAEPSFVGDPDKILMTWKGIPGDEGIYQAVATDDAWSPQQSGGDHVGTSSHPALLGSGGGQMWRAWKGVDGDSNLWWSQGDEGITWTPQRPVPRAGSSHGPAIALF